MLHSYFDCNFDVKLPKLKTKLSEDILTELEFCSFNFKGVKYSYFKDQDQLHFELLIEKFQKYRTSNQLVKHKNNSVNLHDDAIWQKILLTLVTTANQIGKKRGWKSVKVHDDVSCDLTEILLHPFEDWFRFGQIQYQRKCAHIILYFVFQNILLHIRFQIDIQDWILVTAIPKLKTFNGVSDLWSGLVVKSHNQSPILLLKWLDSHRDVHDGFSHLL